MRKHFFYPAAVSTILFMGMVISCKKNKDNDGAANEFPLFKKWHIARHVDTTSYFMGPTVILNYQGASQDYIDFKNDGKLYRFEDGKMDSTTFTINNDTTTLIVNSGPSGWKTAYNIEVLTIDSLQLGGQVIEAMTNSHDREFSHYYLNKQ